jgi:hypothetical protein
MMIRTFALAGLAAVALSAPAVAVTLVTPDVDGDFVTYSVPGNPGNYGVEARGGRSGLTGDWEIGVGTNTSVAGQLNQAQYLWNFPTLQDFSLTWNADGLRFTVGSTTVTDAGKPAPLIGNTLHIYMKRDATLTIDSISGHAFNQSWSTSANPFSDLKLHFWSPDAWGAEGITLTGKMAIRGEGGSAHGIQFKVGEFTPFVTEVPEPATWAMLILGFGLVGASMRRRQAALAA